MKAGFAEPLQLVDRVFVQSARGKLLYFGGCDYLRLSCHPRVLRALQHGLARFGLSTSASRKTTGNHLLYERLERQTARFFDVPSALLVSSGYLANIAAAQALAGSVDHIFVDERSHGSLQDALALSRVPATRFRHRDSGGLLKKVARCSRSKIAVVTDGIFSFDGSIAPLAEYRAAAPEALLWIDDAHAGGVLGTHGRGSLEHAGLSRANTIQTITFSKAFGAYGGAILCGAPFREALIARSSAVSGNTPLPLPLASACSAALRLAASGRRARLRRNLAEFGTQSPIITAGAGASSIQVKRLAAALEGAGIYPSFIRYPGGPADGCFRFAISSEHTLAQVRLLARVIRQNT